MVKVIMVIKQTKAFEIYSEHAKTKKNKLSGKNMVKISKGMLMIKKSRLIVESKCNDWIWGMSRISLLVCTNKIFSLRLHQERNQSLKRLQQNRVTQSMKERNHGSLECSFPHKMREVMKIKYLRFRASWRWKIRKSIDNGGFPLSNYKNVLLHKIASYNNSMSFVWCKIYILQLVSSKVHIAHNLLSRTI